MTDPTDPIESWLSADVELMPAPPGAYQRVARRARRRKAIRAAASIVATAVIIAGGAALPRLATGILTGPDNPNKAVIGSKSAQPVTRPSPRTPSPSPSASGSVRRRPLSNGPALSTAGQGARPAAGFLPTSVTFVNSALGAVIGQAGSCGAGPCVVAAGTADYGGKWTRIGAPPADSPAGSSGVSQLRFLDQLNGWAYGPALYATHDGGVRWTAIKSLPGRVIDLSTVAGRAFAVVATCAGTGSDYAVQCTSFALYSAAANSDQWLRVPGASANGPASPGGLQLTSSQGFLLAGRLLFAGPVTGGTWRQVRTGGAGAPPCLSGASLPAPVQGPALLAPSGAQLYLACSGAAAGGQPGPLTLYLSPDGGQTWQARGPVQAQGTATSLAAIPGGAVVLATTRGLYYSFDAATWQRATTTGRAPQGGFGFVGMTNAQLGVAVPGVVGGSVSGSAGAGGGRIFITRDGGRSWLSSPIG